MADPQLNPTPADPAAPTPMSELPLQPLASQSQQQREQVPNPPPPPTSNPEGLIEHEMNTVQEVHTRIRRRDIVEDPLYNRFKTCSTYVFAIPLFFALLITIGFWLADGFKCRTCYQNVPPATATLAPAKVETDPETKQLLKFLTDKLAEKPATTATATATTETVVKTPPPPSVVVRIPDHLKIEVVGLTPPPQPQVQPTSPPPVVTDAERRNEALYEHLRRRHGIQ